MFIAKVTLGEALILGAVLFILSQTVLKSATLKTWLDDGNAYKNLPALLADTMKGKDGADVDKDSVATAMTAALSKSTVRPIVGGFLDGTEAWLKGADKPTFTLDVSKLKSQLVLALGNSAATRAGRLPTCPGPASDTFDALSTTCIPAGINVEQVRLSVMSDIDNSANFLPNTKLTADDIHINGQPYYRKLANVKQWYGLVNTLALGLLALGLIDCLVISLMAERLFIGLRSAGRYVLSAAFVLLIMGAATYFVGGKLTGSIKSITGSGGAVEAFMLPIIKVVATTLAHWLLGFAGLYLGLAVTLLVMSLALRKMFFQAAKKHQMTYNKVVQPPVAAPVVVGSEPTSPNQPPPFVMG